MSKIILYFLFAIVSVAAYAQQSEEYDDPDESGMGMPTIGITEAVPIIEVVEGVGTVNTANVAFREAPSLESKLVRYSVKSEKVLILGESGDWLKVRMYNNVDAYINRQYVRMAKVFKDENMTANAMDKKVAFEITDILERFNTTLKKSSFAERFNIIPSLSIMDMRKVGQKITITFVYSCVDLENNMIPSYKENGLFIQMRKLLELLFSKLLLTQNSIYDIIIKVPSFAEDGRVTGITKTYAEITMDYNKIDMEKIKESESQIWNYITSSVPPSELFIKFP